MERNTKRSAIGRAAALTGIVALAAVTASMLSGLRHAFGRKRHAPERERVRRALAPMLMHIDYEAWEREFGKLPADFDRVAFRRSLPILDPPLSQTIIDERNEERGE